MGTAHLARRRAGARARQTRWKAERVILVLDDLNTHCPASFCEAFPPAEARRLVQRFAFHYTPAHRSWRNIAETELSVPGRQCLATRLPGQETRVGEVTTWTATRNTANVRVDWHFTTADARIKLKRLYPSL